ncbi:hypothetical protein HDZ31DRAFT_30971 [Schizophyllum fasciatum]
MTSLTDLPPELLLQIIEACRLTGGSLVSLMLTTKSLHDLGCRILHARLRFTSNAQLVHFMSLNHDFHLACPIQSIEIDLPGGASGRGLFLLIRNCLEQCQRMAQEHAQLDEDGRILIDSLCFCLNSHAYDAYRHLENAIKLVNPLSFVWTGPDPPHHFSTAIVPGAARALFGALSTCTRLQSIAISSIAMPEPALLADDNTPTPPPFALPHMPSLRRLYIAQAVFLDPAAVARFALRYVSALAASDAYRAAWGEGGRGPLLEKIRLVDAYRESIWGPRLRRADVVGAGVALWKQARKEPAEFIGVETAEERAVRDALTALVSCEARTERIMGGDRALEQNQDGLLE